MEIKNKPVEELLYFALCILTFGMAYLTRILITESIRASFED